MSEFLKHYEIGLERDRLFSGPGVLELARTQEILTRFLPRPPGVVLDIGGGPGVYAAWLAGRGYAVRLLDPVPLHVEQAREAFARLMTSGAASREAAPGAEVGDARRLPYPDGGADAALLLGPLYHLTERGERLLALKEAARALRPGGALFAAGISRFASTLDGLWRRLLDDPEFLTIVLGDLAEGQHRNPSNKPDYFTTAFFHKPEELATEVREAGFTEVRVIAVEGPGWLLPRFAEDWAEAGRRGRLLDALRRIEEEPSMLGASAHLLAVGKKPG
jgi:SAM-dependent methyltransferase